MVKLFESIKRAFRSAFDWLKSLFKARRKDKTEVEPEAREKKSIKQRVEELVANVKTKAEGFFNRIEDWFCAFIDKVKNFVHKIMIPIARVYVPFYGAFSFGIMALFNTLLASFVFLNVTGPATFVAAALSFVFGNVGLVKVLEKACDDASELMANELQAQIEELEKNDKFATAMKDPEFMKHSDKITYCMNEDSVYKYSKMPKVLKFMASDAYAPTAAATTLGVPTIAAIVCDPILKLSSNFVYGFMVPGMFGLGFVIAGVLPNIVGGIAGYRTTKMMFDNLQAMRDTIDTAYENGEALRKAAYEKRQEEERQRKYGKKGKK